MRWKYVNYIFLNEEVWNKYINDIDFYVYGSHDQSAFDTIVCDRMLYRERGWNDYHSGITFRWEHFGNVSLNDFNQRYRWQIFRPRRNHVSLAENLIFLMESEYSIFA